MFSWWVSVSSTVKSIVMIMFWENTFREKMKRNFSFLEFHSVNPLYYCTYWIWRLSSSTRSSLDQDMGQSWEPKVKVKMSFQPYFNIKDLLIPARCNLKNQILIIQLYSNTRWTFFRVKIVFECDFEISWTLGPWDPWTLGLLDLFPPPPPPPISSSYSPPLVWFGVGGGSFDIGYWDWQLEIDLWPLYWC